MPKNKKIEEPKEEMQTLKPYSDIMKSERGWFTRKDEDIAKRRYFKKYKQVLEITKR